MLILCHVLQSGADTLSEIQQEYTELTEWLMKKTQYLEHLQQTQTLSLNYYVSI